MNFDTPHLKKGDAVPPYNGTLRLYNMRYCPYAQRAVLALNAKEVPYEVININLTDKPEWYSTKSALGKVPALEVSENVTIYESLVIAEYVDDKYPQRPLQSKDPLRKAQDKLIVESFNAVTSSYYSLLLNAEDTAPLGVLLATVDSVATELRVRATQYFAGELPGWVDYMIWPWFERLQTLAVLSDNKINIDLSKLSTWMDGMKRDPAVSQYWLSTELHAKYLKERLGGQADYDMLADTAPVCCSRPRPKKI